MGKCGIIKADNYGGNQSMRYEPITNNSLLYGSNHFIYRTVESDDRIDIFLKSSVHSCKCPLCGKESSDLHATY